MSSRAEKIGELNGKWAFVFKFSLAVFPVILPLILGWTSWVSVEAMSAQTRSDQLAQRVDRYQIVIDRLEGRVRVLENQNARMLTILESIRNKLETSKKE